MVVKITTIRKGVIYNVLFALLIFNVILLAYVYVYYLREPVIIQSLNKKELVESKFRDTRVLTNGVVPNNANRSFSIDYDNDVFLKDGQPFQYVSGSFHYFRAPRAYWRDRLRKLRAAGLNAVCTYIEWSIHEPNPGEYKFTGEQDIEYFIQLCIEENLLVILRPGPYICAERDFGGFPPWLLSKYPNIELRTNDPDYLREVKKWFNVLFTRLKRFLYGNGGPVILIQVENEYGSYFACNFDYQIWLRDEMKSHVDGAAVLFTTDGNSEHFLKCGAIEGVYATVDFGTNANVNESFKAMRQYSPKGPLVNSEFYPGWLSHWNEKLITVDTEKVLATLREMLKLQANVNFYMIFGGTNFEFMNGANYFNDEYQPQLTSYDYDAPLNEAGDPTPKYFALRDEIGKHFKLPDIPLPKPSLKGDYGKVTLKPLISLFNKSYIPDAVVQQAEKPKTFESMEISYGFVLYEVTIPYNISDPAILYIQDLRDRAVVYVDHVPAGVLSREFHIYSIPILAVPGRKLSLLVENQGRINYGNYIKDFKGLLSDPLLSGRPLEQWTMTGFPLKSVSWTHKLTTSSHDVRPPAFYVGELILPDGEAPRDTFVDLSGWGKGVIFINDFNLGRYWPSIGSQVTLYVPGCYLLPAPEKNLITVFEVEYTPSNSYDIEFKDKPYLDKIPPSRSSFKKQ